MSYILEFWGTLEWEGIERSDEREVRERLRKVGEEMDTGFVWTERDEFGERDVLYRKEGRWF